MEIVPSGRLSLPPEQERGMLQAKLIACYRADGRYLGIVRQDLAPLWRSVGTLLINPPSPLPPWWRQTRCLFSYLDRLYNEQRLVQDFDDGAPVWPELHAYVVGVRSAVSTGLRLTVAGEPAEWALDCVHFDVLDIPPVVPGYCYSSASHEATIKVAVSAFSATIAACGRDGKAEHRERIDAPLYLQVKAYMREVRAAAKRALDEELQRIEAELDRSFPHRNIGPLVERIND